MSYLQTVFSFRTTLLGTAQAKTVTKIQTVTETREVVSNEYIQPNKTNDSFVDMRTVIDFTANDNGLQLYFDDGTGYWWERKNKRLKYGI